VGIILGEMAAARSGSIKLEKRDKIWVTAKEFQKSFYVLGTQDEGESSLVATIGVPQRGTLYEGALCLGHQIRESASVLNPYTQTLGILAEIVAEFTNDISPNEFEDEVLDKDPVTGDPIETTAHERLILTGPQPIPILEVSRYEQWPFNPVTLLVYSGRLNEVDFYGAPRGTALLQPIQAPEEELEGELFVKATYRVKFKMKFDPDNPSQFLEDTWKAELLNQGQQYLDDEGKIKRATDANGNPIKVNLAEDGTVLDPEAEPHYVKFNRFTYADLNDLNLGPYA